jgi:hypothetical protein
MRTSLKARRLGAGTLLGCLILSATSTSCSTSGINEVYTTGKEGPSDHRTEFFVGEEVICNAKVTTGRDGVRIDYKLRVLEIDGQKGNFGIFPLGYSIQDKTNAGLAAAKPVPESFIQAQLNHPARIVTAPDAFDDATTVTLAQDIYDTLLDHMKDPLSHKEGRIDPTVQLVEALGKCSKLDATETKENCAFSLNVMKVFYDRHISDATYHEVPDQLHPVRADDAVLQSQGQPPPPFPIVQVSVYPLATDFKYKLTAHIFDVRDAPVLVPGRFRCEVTFDEDSGSAEFTVIKGFRQKPPADPAIPKQGKCNIDTVAYCPDPNKGVNVLRCCTVDGTCGIAPKGIPVCAPNP